MTRIIVGLTGPSGSGKSTGANALLYQLRAQAGGEWKVVSTSEPLRREIERRHELPTYSLDDWGKKKSYQKELEMLQLELQERDPRTIMNLAVATHPSANIIIDRPCTDDDFKVLLEEEALFIVITASDAVRRHKMGSENFEATNLCASEQALLRNLKNLSSRTEKLIKIENVHYDQESLELSIHQGVYHYFDTCRSKRGQLVY